MVNVVKSQPADHSTKGTESVCQLLTTDHVLARSLVVSSDQFMNSSTGKYLDARV